MKHQIPSTLASIEATESQKQAAADQQIPDPAPDVAAKAIATYSIESLDKKPYDCTCGYPQERFRSGSGHHVSCRTHQRWLQTRDFQ